MCPIHLHFLYSISSICAMDPVYLALLWNIHLDDRSFRQARNNSVSSSDHEQCTISGVSFHAAQFSGLILMSFMVTCILPLTHL